MSESFFCIYCAMKYKKTLNKYIKDETYLEWNDIQTTTELKRVFNNLQDIRNCLKNKFKRF